MDYRRIYDSLIYQRRLNPAEGYTEKHHIIPRCMGGKDNEENLVVLSAKEHYLAHRLLCKIYPTEPGLWFALGMMSWCEAPTQRRYIPAKTYEIIRKEFAKAASINQTGEKNSGFGTRWVTDVKNRRSIKIPKDKPLPKDFVEGRVIDWNKSHHTRKCVVCGHIGCMSVLSSFCSKKCKKNNSTSYLDGKEKEFIIEYKRTKSLNKTLKLFGGKNAGGYIGKAKEIILNSNDQDVIDIYQNNLKRKNSRL